MYTYRDLMQSIDYDEDIMDIIIELQLIMKMGV